MLTCAVLAATAPLVSSEAASDYETGLALGAKAYVYGVPLLDTARIYETAVSVNVPDGMGHGPVNRFSHVRRLADATERTVNAPNNDTLYSVAWLDIRKQPVVLHAPAIRHRFWEFELVDPWTNNFYNVTSVRRPLGRGDFGASGGGDWAVVGPRFRGRLPRGVKRVTSRYDRVWVIGRTYLRSASDLRNVRRIQDEYAITPLSKLGTGFRPQEPRRIDRELEEATIPGTQSGEDPLEFYGALGREMRRFPAPAADKPLLYQLRLVGIGAGLDPTKAALSAETLRGLRDAVNQGPGSVQTAALALYLREFDKHNGYLIGDLGNWGTSYELRAIGDRLGVGGQRANIATYPVALTDHTKAPLSGSKRYVLHIPRSRLPIPVQAFWSLTMYDTNSYFVPNPIDRWALNDRSNLRRNADGSIDIYVQHDRPSRVVQLRNWLPAPPAGSGFRLIWRLYDLDRALTGVLNGSGWQPPPVLPCDTTGHAADGTACAS